MSVTKILKEIVSYNEDSVERTVSESGYIQYWISNKEYMSAIENSNCRQNLKYNLYPLNEWKKSQYEILRERFNSIRNGVYTVTANDKQRLDKEMRYERHKIDMQYFKEKNIKEDLMNVLSIYFLLCQINFQDLMQRQPLYMTISPKE